MWGMSTEELQDSEAPPDWRPPDQAPNSATPFWRPILARASEECLLDGFGRVCTISLVSFTFAIVICYLCPTYSLMCHVFSCRIRLIANDA
jgi:hypothetical protein